MFIHSDSISWCIKKSTGQGCRQALTILTIMDIKRFCSYTDCLVQLSKKLKLHILSYLW